MPPQNINNSQEEHKEEEGKYDYKGSPYVSVFCPQWSEEGLQKPSLLESRSITEGTNVSTEYGGDGRSSSCGTLDDQDNTGMDDLNDSFRFNNNNKSTPADVIATTIPSPITTTTMTAAESTQEHPRPSTGAGQPTSSFFVPDDGDDDSMVITTNKSNTTNLTGTTVTSTTNNSSSFESSMSERDMFSMFARGGGPATTGDSGNPPPAGGGGASGNVTDDDSMMHSVSSAGSLRGSFIGTGYNRNSLVLGDLANNNNNNPPEGNNPNTPLSDQELFTQWVQQSPANVGGNAGGPMGTVNFTDSVRETPATNVFANTNFLGDMLSDSDDDSVVGSEMKKKVGINEHLHAALASLEQQDANDGGGAANGAEDAAELQYVPLTKDGGRPLSNQELMDGHAPLFGVDDPPLPSEADLGNHETRDEQQRSKEQRRIQTIIEKLCPQNVFGPLACPNPASSPDDNLSWNNMSAPLQHNMIPPPGNSFGRGKVCWFFFWKDYSSSTW